MADDPECAGARLPAPASREIMGLNSHNASPEHTMKDMIDALRKFRDERDWQQFHNPKDLSLALSIEASELLEAFLWKQPEEADPQRIREELADVFAYAFLLADACQLDVNEIVMAKLRQNEEKYPVAKARGSAQKYDKL